MTEPKQGFIYKAGEKMTISWISNGCSKFNLDYSTDFGKTWTSIAQNEAGTSDNGYHFSYSWDVPAAALDGKNAIVRVLDAADPQVWSARNSFAKDIRFGADGAVAHRGRLQIMTEGNLNVSMQRGALIIDNQAAAGGTIDIYQSNGRCVASQATNPNKMTRINMNNFSAGTYIIRVKNANSHIYERHFIYNPL
jgi:hypothetical protein